MYRYEIGFKNTNQRRYLKIKEKKIPGYIIDETLIKVGAEFIWLWWIAIESKNKEILALSISMERNMCVAWRFLSRRVNDYGKHPVSTDDVGGIWYPLQSCKFLELDHHIHFSYEENIIERTMQYIKDSIESLMMIIFLVLERRNLIKY